MADSTTAPAPWLYQPVPTWRTTLLRYYRSWLVRTMVYLVLWRRRWLHPVAYKPTVTKSYPHQPKLRHRVFFPKDHDQQKAGQELLPLYIDFHGGGFVLGDAELDDDFCRTFADRFGFIVVSIEYELSPSVYFPGALYDIAANVEAVFNDASLPYDTNKIVLGGFSAGGTAAFSVTQILRKRGYQIQALVGFYACLDMYTHTEQKKRNRSQRSQNQPDNLARAAPLLTWAYVRAGQNLQDGLLSPVFAEPEALPRHVYMVSAEYDILSHESEQFADKIATANRDHNARGDGKGEAIASTSERQPLGDGVDGWREGTVRWEIATGFAHGFTSESVAGTREEGSEAYCERMYERVARWILDEVFSSQTK